MNLRFLGAMYFRYEYIKSLKLNLSDPERLNIVKKSESNL